MIEYVTLGLGPYTLTPDPAVIEMLRGWLLRAFIIICGMTVSFAVVGLNRIADSLTFLILFLAVSFFVFSVLLWFLH